MTAINEEREFFARWMEKIPKAINECPRLLERLEYDGLCDYAKMS